jgi:hypothetical protein
MVDMGGIEVLVGAYSSDLVGENITLGERIEAY